ncbi:MAG TPA: response regulator [Anaerolineae bacterium]|nr:response regulator [Anaerolineae bacterium]
MSKRILVVDDDSTILFVLTRYLTQLGPEFQVTSCGSGAEALALDMARPYDLVISDCNIPGLTGLDLAQALITRRPDVKLILMSGGFEPDFPLDGFLAKPFTPDEARAAVRAALAG